MFFGSFRVFRNHFWLFLSILELQATLWKKQTTSFLSPKSGWNWRKKWFLHLIFVPVCVHTYFGVRIDQYGCSRSQSTNKLFWGLIAPFLASFWVNLVWASKNTWNKPFLPKFLHQFCVPVCAHTRYGAWHDQNRKFRPPSLSESFGCIMGQD